MQHLQNLTFLLGNMSSSIKWKYFLLVHIIIKLEVY